MKTYKVKIDQMIFVVETITRDDIPDLPHSEDFTKFYQVKSPNGVICFYLGKGNKHVPEEVVVWYAKHLSFYSGYGDTFKEAIENAMKDGWKYA